MIALPITPTRRRLPALFLGAALATGGCALVVSFDDVTLDQPGSGGAGAGGAGGDAGGGAGGGVVGPEDCTIFVAPNGDDRATGRDIPGAVASLGKAIEIAAESDVAVAELVCVCGATDQQELYVEPAPLVIDRPTSLRGTYDCETWERPQLEREDIVRRALSTVIRAGQVDGPTLTIQGALGPEVVVDGLAFGTALTGGGAEPTVRIDQASPIFTDSAVFGPALDVGTAVSLSIEGGAKAAIVRTLVVGGTGNSTDGDPSTVGLAIVDASPHVDGTAVFGGGGFGFVSTGSVGVLVLGHGAAPQLTESLFLGGAGRALAGLGSVALRLLAGADVTVVSCAIHAGSGETNVGISSVGVVVEEGAHLKLRRSFVYGGDSGDGSTSILQFRGAMLIDGTAQVVSNMIHAGLGFKTIAVLVSGGSAELYHNTIYAGYAVDGAPPEMMALRIATGSADLGHNLFFGEPQLDAWAFSLDGDAEKLTFFDGNAIVGFQKVEDVFASLDDLAIAHGSADGNVRITEDCTVESEGECFEAVCVDDPSCGNLQFDAGSHGVNTVLSDGGFAFLDGASCFLTASSEAVAEPPEILRSLTDVFGASYGATHSIGAHAFPTDRECSALRGEEPPR